MYSVEKLNHMKDSIEDLRYDIDVIKDEISALNFYQNSSKFWIMPINDSLVKLISPKKFLLRRPMVFNNGEECNLNKGEIDSLIYHGVEISKNTYDELESKFIRNQKMIDSIIRMHETKNTQTETDVNKIIRQNYINRLITYAFAVTFNDIEKTKRIFLYKVENKQVYPITCHFVDAKRAKVNKLELPISWEFKNTKIIDKYAYDSILNGKFEQIKNNNYELYETLSNAYKMITPK